MKAIMKYILGLLLLSSLCYAQTTNYKANVSKRGTVAAPFLNISQGARATAMGSAFVAVADDPSTVFWNAAGIARLDKNGVVVEHTEWIADLKYNFLAGNISLGNYGSLGFSFIGSDYGEMAVTTIEFPEGNGERFKVSDMAFSLNWAINLTDNFSIGINPKFVYQGIWNMSDYAFAVDLGVLYDTPFQGITLGMSITNFGGKMNLDGNKGVINYDPDDETLGNNDKIPAELLTDGWDLPLGFKVGVSYTALQNEDHKLIIAADASHPNNDYESVNAGGEYIFNDIFAIRGGYKSLFLQDNEESFTLGAGIKQHLMGNVSIEFNYSYSDFGKLSDVQKFSVGVNF